MRFGVDALEDDAYVVGDVANLGLEEDGGFDHVGWHVVVEETPTEDREWFPLLRGHGRVSIEPDGGSLGRAVQLDNGKIIGKFIGQQHMLGMEYRLSGKQVFMLLVSIVEVVLINVDALVRAGPTGAVSHRQQNVRGDEGAAAQMGFEVPLDGQTGRVGVSAQGGFGAAHDEGSFGQ